MATTRRRTKSTGSTTGPAPAASKSMAKLIEALVAGLTAIESVYIAASPIMANILRHDSTFGSKALTSEEEFLFKGVRMGQRSLIFEFTQAGASEFKQMELPENKVFDAFPVLQGQASQAILSYIAPIEMDSSGVNWSKAKDIFLKHFDDLAADAVQKAEAEAAAKAMGTYANDPHWGRF